MVDSYLWDGLRYVNVVTGNLHETFISGVTRPQYEIKQDFSGARNIGTNPMIPLVPYSGPIEAGIANITAPTVFENILFSTPLDVRAPATFRNCRLVLPTSYTQADSIKACVRVLNGGVNNYGAKFEGFEIHNRAQRPFNGITGRNFTAERMVITGCVDGFSDSTSGSSPLLWGYDVKDSIVTSLAWWYSPTINPDIHVNDTGSHSDSIQKTTSLQSTVTNTALLSYLDEFVGTGTPGSGAETNPYRTPSGYQFIAPQAQMEDWRDQHGSFMTLPQYSVDGEAHRIATNGSIAPVMFNNAYLDVDHCYFAGGTVQVNASGAPDLSGVIQARLKNNIFYNDMVNGPGSRTLNRAVKGHAVLVSGADTFLEFTNNKWADGSSVEITRL